MILRFILIVLFVSALSAANCLIAQRYVPVGCEPTEISKATFDKMTAIFLSIPTLRQNIKTIFSGRNSFLYISNRFKTNFFYCVIFFLDSNNNIQEGFFSKLAVNKIFEPPMVILKKKKLRDFKALLFDTLDTSKFFTCGHNAIDDEEREMIFVNMNNEITGGLYLRGHSELVLKRGKKNEGLAGLRERVRNLKVPRIL